MVSHRVLYTLHIEQRGVVLFAQVLLSCLIAIPTVSMSQLPPCLHYKCRPIEDSLQDVPSWESEKPPDVGYYKAGYVCRVYDTMATVAEHILKDSKGIKENPVELQRCLDQLKRIYELSTLR